MHDTRSLESDLRALGIAEGGLLIVHSGYKALGEVDGGPPTVIAALRRAVGHAGTLLTPSFTTNLVDPYTWPEPPPPEERIRIMAEMPCFDPAKSAPYKMGAIVNALWRTPGVRRSGHPVSSWLALGPRAEELTRNHPIDDPEGLYGPVGRAYRGDAQVLLLGVEHDADTTIHLAESLLDMPHLRSLPDRFPVDEGGRREWRLVAKTTKCSDGFVRIDPHLEAAGAIRRGRVGDAPCQLLQSRGIVKVATGLLSAQPTALFCGDEECVHCPTSRQVLEDWQPAPSWRDRLV